MEPISFTRPIDEQPNNHIGLETAMAKAFKQVFADVFQQRIQDILDYGAPHLGSRTVVERFTKQDGLVVLRRPQTSDTLMRVIYANWSSMANKRGLGFLEFVLRMLWTDQWQIKRMWHPISTYLSYPRFLVDEEKPNHFLTSRIRISIDESVDLAELIELSPILRKLVPANIVVKVHAKALDTELGDTELGAAVIAKNYLIFDESNGITNNLPVNQNTIQDFDFAVIRYIWDGNGGIDLDTRTRIINPSRNIDVGWSRAVSDGAYLFWNGDNTGSGVESVLLNLKQLKQDFSNQNNFEISLRAYWYSQKNTGNFSIQFESYKGGTMQPNGFDYVNVGGHSVQSMTLNANVQHQQNSNNDGVEVGRLTYHSSILEGSLTLI